MSLKNRILTLLCITAACISSCANKTSPTGGPKDEDAPVLLTSSPLHEELNFDKTILTLEFDEYIKLNNPKEEIIITPRLLGEYDIDYKKNKVILRLEDTLQTNTTYTFSFRESIQDLNESNSPTNLQIAFSTGDYLDSLSITGRVNNLMDNKPAKDVTLSLYATADTLDLFNSPPIYYTKSNDKGVYTFNNLKNGEYNVFALKDNNKNLKLESKTESYGYVENSVLLDSNIVSLNLSLLRLDVTPLNLQSNRTRGHYFVLKYNKFVSSYIHKNLDSDSPEILSSFSEDHKEIVYYNNTGLVDSLGIILTAYDTINYSTIDTVYVKFIETKRDKANFEIKYSSLTIDKEHPRIDSEITFSKPVYTINFDSLYFQIDSIQRVSIDTNDLNWNERHTSLTITKTLDPLLFQEQQAQTTTADSLINNKKPNISNEQQLGSSLKSDKPQRKNNDTRLYFGKSTFLSIEQDSSSLHKVKSSFTNPKTTGSILIKVETAENSFYVQLIDSNGELVTQEYNKKEFSFDNTAPGKYTIRILVDSNNNKIWDIGDIIKSRLPEPIFFYVSDEGSTEITLRANWVLGPNIIKF
jgi:uncharacterized protein (DUF2141 family)